MTVLDQKISQLYAKKLNVEGLNKFLTEATEKMASDIPPNPATITAEQI